MYTFKYITYTSMNYLVNNKNIPSSVRISNIALFASKDKYYILFAKFY